MAPSDQPALSRSWLAVRLGTQPAMVDAMRRSGQLIGVPGDNGEISFPSWQFGPDGKPLPGGAILTQRKTGNLMKSPWKFKKYGECGLLLRFKDDDWSKNFLFDLIKQSYLISSRHIAIIPRESRKPKV
jgi:hypothetical protein